MWDPGELTASIKLKLATPVCLIEKAREFFRLFQNGAVASRRSPVQPDLAYAPKTTVTERDISTFHPSTERITPEWKLDVSVWMVRGRDFAPEMM